MTEQQLFDLMMQLRAENADLRAQLEEKEAQLYPDYPDPEVEASHGRDAYAYDGIDRGEPFRG